MSNKPAVVVTRSLPSAVTARLNGQKITKRVGIDVNPSSKHVIRQGPHLNLQTQINGRPVTKGPLADPHIPIDPKTIRPGDY
jgi:hypothetical protein